VRLSVAKFFSAGAGGLVGSSPAPDPDEKILNCYRLADRFKQNPAVFLNMPLSEVSLHLAYTIRLIEAQNAARTYAHEHGEDE
jgi:hypothetical protein